MIKYGDGVVPRVSPGRWCVQYLDSLNSLDGVRSEISLFMT